MFARMYMYEPHHDVGSLSFREASRKLLFIRKHDYCACVKKPPRQTGYLIETVEAFSNCDRELEQYFE